MVLNELQDGNLRYSNITRRVLLSIGLVGSFLEGKNQFLLNPEMKVHRSQIVRVQIVVLKTEVWKYTPGKLEKGFFWITR